MDNVALASLFRKEFEWCCVAAGESVAIVTEPASSPSYVAASLASLAGMGAQPFQVMLPLTLSTGDIAVVAQGSGASTILADFPHVVELLGKCGLVIDLTLEGLVHSPETKTVLAGGARMLWIREPADALARLLPTAERVRRIDRSVELLRSAKEMIVTSKAGTRFRANLEGALLTGSRGFCAERGRWAHWGQGLAAAYVASLDVDGEIVLDIGDIVFPFNRYVDSRTTLRFREGFVEAIEGEGLDAALIRDYMARWNDRNAYGISHVGWGLHERGLWHALSLYGSVAMGLDGRVFEGNFLFSTGPNHAAGRQSGCHFDIPMRNCSIFLDGTPVVIDGVIVEPSIRRDGA
jgi:2,5-dihydroxypyridine 5,6-dioxygenase